MGLLSTLIQAMEAGKKIPASEIRQNLPLPNPLLRGEGTKKGGVGKPFRVNPFHSDKSLHSDESLDKARDKSERAGSSPPTVLLRLKEFSGYSDTIIKILINKPA